MVVNVGGGAGGAVGKIPRARQTQMLNNQQQSQQANSKQ